MSLAGTLVLPTPVWEAIRQLIQEALVEYEPHRVLFAIAPSPPDRLDVPAREAIEVGGDCTPHPARSPRPTCCVLRVGACAAAAAGDRARSC